MVQPMTKAHFNYSFVFILGFLSFGTGLQAAELIKVTQSNADFDTTIRVQVSAQVLQSPDPALLQRTAPFIQSLRYSAQKQTALNKSFSSFADVDKFAREYLCVEKHEVKLQPVRDLGAKGTESFLAHLPATHITLTGVHVTDKGKGFQKSYPCAAR
jgi:hypothetical protein